ncbi:MAG: hypothetical protein WB757_00425, partial [Candidatus Cybelea sp.]
AARRERRAKAKAARSTTAVAPQRYRKKRAESGGTVAVEEPYTGEEMIDPLDAQQAGLHDAAMEQGHEEIALNLDDFPSTGSGQAVSEDAKE